MKVTFLSGEYPPMQGGIADYTARLADHLSRHQIMASVLISRRYQRDEPVASPTQPIAVYPALSGWGIRCWPEISRFLAHHPSDILHIQYQAAAFDLKGWVNWLPWAMRQRRKRPQIVTTFHDLRIPYLFPKAGSLRWRSILALARYSDAVICTNREDLLTLQQHSWATHIHQIPLGNNVPVNPPPGYDRQVWRQGLGLPEEAVVLAYFGFLSESKGGEDLIALLAALVKRGIKARLLMIGGDIGDSDPSNRVYAEWVHRLIAEGDLARYIIFTGYVDLPEVSANLLAADMVVMPYRDGVSFRRTTLIAALQHGLPIISTTSSLAQPQIRVGENMLLVPPGAVGQLTQSVIRVATDPALRARLSQGAIDLGRQFDWAEIAARTKGVYEGLLKQFQL